MNWFIKLIYKTFLMKQMILNFKFNNILRWIIKDFREKKNINYLN